VRSCRCCFSQALSLASRRCRGGATRDSRSVASGSVDDRLEESDHLSSCTRCTRCLRGRFAERGFAVQDAPRAANSESFALPVGIGTDGRGMRMDAGSRLDRQRVLTQREMIRRSATARRKSAFRSLVRSAEGNKYGGAAATGAATAPPRSCRIVPENQYALLPTPPASPRLAGCGTHGRSFFPADERPRVSIGGRMKSSRRLRCQRVERKVADIPGGYRARDRNPKSSSVGSRPSHPRFRSPLDPREKGYR